MIKKNLSRTGQFSFYKPPTNEREPECLSSHSMSGDDDALLSPEEFEVSLAEEGDQDPEKYDVLQIDVDGTCKHFNFTEGAMMHDGLRQLFMSRDDTSYSSSCLPKKTKHGVLSVMMLYAGVVECEGQCLCCNKHLPAKMSTRSITKAKEAAVQLNAKLAGIIPDLTISPVVFTLRYTPISVNLTDDKYLQSINDWTHLTSMRSMPLSIHDYLSIAAESGIFIPAFQNGQVPDSHFWDSILRIWRAINMGVPVMNSDVIGSLRASNSMRPVLKWKLLVIQKMQEEALVAEFRNIGTCSPDDREQRAPVEDSSDSSIVDMFNEMCDIAAAESSPAVKEEMMKKIEAVMNHVSNHVSPAVGENSSQDPSDLEGLEGKKDK